MKKAGRKVETADEFIRRDLNLHGPMTSIWEQYRTRHFQKELEDSIPDVADFVICDSGTLSPYFYAVQYFDPTDARQRIVLQDMYRHFIDDIVLKRYDLIFYVPFIPGADLNDGTRYQTENEIRTLDAHMRLMFTKLHNLPNIHEVQAGFDKRFEEVMWKILGVDFLTSKEYEDRVLKLHPENV